MSKTEFPGEREISEFERTGSTIGMLFPVPIVEIGVIEIEGEGKTSLEGEVIEQLHGLNP